MKFVTLFLSVTLPLYVADQITKFWTVSHFPEPIPPNFSSGVEKPVIPGFFNLLRVHNQGVAFGTGNGSAWAPIVFLIVPIIALVLITIGWRKNFFAGIAGKIAAGLLLAGVFGNLTDRLIQGSRLSYMEGAPLWDRLKAGYVVDFLDFTIPVVNYRWPVFNVADSCICVAAVLLFISGLRADMKDKKSASAA